MRAPEDGDDGEGMGRMRHDGTARVAVPGSAVFHTGLGVSRLQAKPQPVVWTSRDSTRAAVHLYLGFTHVTRARAPRFSNRFPRVIRYALASGQP